jgi:hypothetical protein
LSVAVVAYFLADGVNEPENEYDGGKYREFDTEDPDYQPEFLEDANGDKSNIFPFDAC